MVVVVWVAKVLKGKNTTTVPTSTWLVNLDSHPVWLVVTFTFLLTSATNITVVVVTWDKVWVSHGTRTFSDWVLHVENINTLSLTQHLESLQTSGLVQVGWDSTWLSTWTNQRRVWTSDFCQGRGGLRLQFLGGVEGNSGNGEEPGLSSSTCKCAGKPELLVLGFKISDGVFEGYEYAIDHGT